MIKKMTCIDCPQGCQLQLTIEEGKVLSVAGNRCKKGITYAKQEVENPMRTLTSSVITENLPVKMAPVKTSRPIPKEKLLEGMAEVKKIRLKKPVKAGEIIAANFLNLNVNLVSTRTI